MSKDSGLQKKEAGGKSSKKRAKFSIPVGRSLAKAFEITGHRAITPAGQLYEVKSLKGKGPGVLMVFDANVSVVFKKDILPNTPT